MADIENEPAASPVGHPAPLTETERRSVRHTIALIDAALADHPADLAPVSADDEAA